MMPSGPRRNVWFERAVAYEAPNSVTYLIHVGSQALRMVVQRPVGESTLCVSHYTGVVISKRVRVAHTRILSRVPIR